MEVSARLYSRIAHAKGLITVSVKVTFGHSGFCVSVVGRTDQVPEIGHKSPKLK